MSEKLPAVARLYYTGLGHRRYKRASTRSGPGEPLCFVSVAEEWLRTARSTTEYWKAEHLKGNEEIESLRRMLGAACAALGAINEALGLDPDDGGAEPIIGAIAELRKERDGWADAGYAASTQQSDEFKNFHRLLCERFNYVHDEKDWNRDQLSLIEHIARKAAPAPEVAEPVYQARARGVEQQWSDVNHNGFRAALAMRSMEARILYAAPTLPAHSLEALRDVIRCLRETEAYRDDEGEVTNALQDLVSRYSSESQRNAKCATCNDQGMIGGPSYYAPDEGGAPCPDCTTTVR